MAKPSIWTADAGCGDFCGPADVYNWIRRARLIQAIAGDLGDGALTQPPLVALTAVLEDIGLCADCDNEVEGIRATAAPVRDLIVSYAKAGVKQNRTQGAAWPAPTCTLPVCNSLDQLSSALAFDVVEDLVIGVNTPEVLDTKWPPTGVRPPLDLNFVEDQQYAAGVASWLPTLSALARSARGGWSLAHEPDEDYEPEDEPEPEPKPEPKGGGLGMAAVIAGGLWLLARRR